MARAKVKVTVEFENPASTGGSRGPGTQPLYGVLMKDVGEPHYRPLAQNLPKDWDCMPSWLKVGVGGSNPKDIAKNVKYASRVLREPIPEEIGLLSRGLKVHTSRGGFPYEAGIVYVIVARDDLPYAELPQPQD